MNDTRKVIQNPELMNNCSTNITEFYNTSDFDKNSMWKLIFSTPNSELLIENTINYEFNPLKKIFEYLYLSYIPIEILNQNRTNLIDFFPTLYKNYKARIEGLNVMNESDDNYYSISVFIFPKPAYPFKIIESWSSISLAEALSKLGGILKIISYLRYLYIFEDYDYDKFHFDLLKNSFDFKFNDKNKFIDYKLDIQANHTADEINIKKNNINETYNDLIQTNKNPKVKVKEKLKESKSKTCYSINNIENDYKSFLIPFPLKKEVNLDLKIINEIENLNVWEWFRMKISFCKCCRFYEKKIHFYNFINENLNIKNIIKNLKKEEDKLFVNEEIKL